MFSFLSVFTVTSIATQTIMCLLMGWMTLECKLRPEHQELQELTTAKLLYLYDPQACGKIYFYNYTVLLRHKLSLTIIQWPIKNDIAASFREKIKIWVALHCLWFFFCIMYMTQGHRSCAFYGVVLPFSLVGLLILVTDILYTAFFLADTPQTGSEVNILHYINYNNDSIYRLPMHYNKPFSNVVNSCQQSEDTSWVSLLFAYISCRGIVIWFFNFWMIKDNFFEGLALHRQFRAINLIIQKQKAVESLMSL